MDSGMGIGRRKRRSLPLGRNIRRRKDSRRRGCQRLLGSYWACCWCKGRVVMLLRLKGIGCPYL